jgi:hypothetical protein
LARSAKSKEASTLQGEGNLDELPRRSGLGLPGIGPIFVTREQRSSSSDSGLAPSPLEPVHMSVPKVHGRQRQAAMAG